MRLTSSFLKCLIQIKKRKVLHSVTYRQVKRIRQHLTFLSDQRMPCRTIRLVYRQAKISLTVTATEEGSFDDLNDNLSGKELTCVKAWCDRLL